MRRKGKSEGGNDGDWVLVVKRCCHAGDRREGERDGGDGKGRKAEKRQGELE